MADHTKSKLNDVKTKKKLKEYFTSFEGLQRETLWLNCQTHTRTHTHSHTLKYCEEIQQQFRNSSTVSP